jgi:hypothetical protein
VLFGFRRRRQAGAALNNFHQALATLALLATGRRYLNAEAFAYRKK